MNHTLHNYSFQGVNCAMSHQYFPFMAAEKIIITASLNELSIARSIQNGDQRVLPKGAASDSHDAY